jgi:hypothetical protein
MSFDRQLDLLVTILTTVLVFIGFGNIVERCLVCRSS